MFRTNISKLMRRILALAVLTTGLVIASSGLVQSNAAAICCDQCLINFDNCLNNCSDQACIDACNATLVQCHQFCKPCD